MQLTKSRANAIEGAAKQHGFDADKAKKQAGGGGSTGGGSTKPTPKKTTAPIAARPKPKTPPKSSGGKKSGGVPGYMRPTVSSTNKTKPKK